MLKTCKYCEITSDLVDFYKQKYENGKIYTWNVCMPCKREKALAYRLEVLKKDPTYYSRRARLWECLNRKKYLKIKKKHYLKDRYLKKGY